MGTAQPHRRPRAWAAALAAASLVLLSACQLGRSTSNPSQEEVLAGGLAYLQTKYSRPFKVASAKWGAPWSGPLNLDGKETTLYAYPEGGNSKLPFMVSVDLSTTPITFHDYYAVQLVAPAYLERVKPITTSLFPGASVAVYQPGSRGGAYPPDTMKANTTFDQFKAWADTAYDMEFCVVAPLDPGQDEASVRAAMPTLVAGLSSVARYGTVVVTGYPRDVFDSPALRAALNDEAARAECANGLPVAKVQVAQHWKG